MRSHCSTSPRRRSACNSEGTMNALWRLLLLRMLGSLHRCTGLFPSRAGVSAQAGATLFTRLPRAEAAASPLTCSLSWLATAGCIHRRATSSMLKIRWRGNPGKLIAAKLKGPPPLPFCSQSSSITLCQGKVLSLRIGGFFPPAQRERTSHAMSPSSESHAPWFGPVLLTNPCLLCRPLPPPDPPATEPLLGSWANPIPVNATLPFLSERFDVRSW